MKTRPSWWSAAQAENLLPADAEVAADADSPSWLVLLLGFFGACLVLLPFLASLLLAFGTEVFTMPVAGIVAWLLAGMAILLWRGKNGIFLTQLGLNLSLAAQIMWLIGWQGEVGWLVLLGLLVLQITMLAGGRQIWVQRILGVLATWTLLALPLAATLGFDSAVEIAGFAVDDLLATWPSNVLLLALLWALWRTQAWRFLGRPAALPLSALADGVAVGILLALVGRSTFFAVALGAAAAGSADVVDAGSQSLWAWSWQAGVQAAVVVVSAIWLWRHWSVDRQSGRLLVVLYALLLAVCPLEPDIGVLTLIGTVAAAHGEKRLLWLTMATLLLSLGNFYYALAWPLADKALLLALLGALLAGALVLLRPVARVGATGLAPPPKWQLAALLLASLLPVLAVRQDVAQKEMVIAQGQKVFLPLLPRDPRSLLQGDYMALRFDLPSAVRQALEQKQQETPGVRRVLAIAELDSRGVASLLRLAAAGEVAAAPQILLPLQQLKGEWVLVTDAYFFPEGQGVPLAQARFGEFRVLPDGRALLVGLANADLQVVQPAVEPPADENAPAADE